MQKRKLDKSDLRIGSNSEARTKGQPIAHLPAAALPNAEVFFLLRRDRTLSRSQDVFLNLAGRGLGKFLNEGDAVRRLEMREFYLNRTEFSISLVADSVYPTKLFASEILFSM